MALKVVGQHKGSVSGLDLDTATVLDLKLAVSRDSGLPVAGLKLLAGVMWCVCCLVVRVCCVYPCLLRRDRSHTFKDSHNEYCTGRWTESPGWARSYSSRHVSENIILRSSYFQNSLQLGSAWWCRRFVIGCALRRLASNSSTYTSYITRLRACM